MTIHPTAVVDPAACVAPDAVVGPFCVVGPQVELGARVVLASHVVITGDTAVGDDTVVSSFAVLGGVPQDLKYAGEATRLRIGARNRIREHVTMNTGTTGGGGETRVGDDGLYMAGCHVAHDAQVGDRVVIANGAALAGHVEVGDDVVIGGLAGVHQWVRIGAGAMIGALAMVTRDVIPHGLVQGPRGDLDGLNLVGLKRRGATRDDLAALRAAYEDLKRGTGPLPDRAAALAGSPVDAVRDIAAFLAARSDRQFLPPT